MNITLYIMYTKYQNMHINKTSKYCTNKNSQDIEKKNPHKIKR